MEFKHEIMLEQTTIQKIKDALILIVIGAVVSLIPFYFQTNAMTKENKVVNDMQTLQINQNNSELKSLEINRAIDATEIRQIKESLDRIEKKLDKLIDEKEPKAR